MNKIKLLSIAIIALLILNFCILGILFLNYSKPTNKENSNRKLEGPKKIIIEKLKLDSTQVIAYQKLIDIHRKLVANLNDSISSTKNKLYQTLITNNYTEKDSLILALGSLQINIEKVHYDHFTQIKNICKPEQLSDFNKLTTELSSYFGKEHKDPPPLLKNN